MKVKLAITALGLLGVLVLPGCRLVRLVTLYNSTKRQVAPPATANTIDIPFAYRQDWIMLHLVIKQAEHSLEGDFLFDSGASTSLFDSCQPLRVWIPENVAELPVQGALGKSYRKLKIAKDISLQAGQFSVFKPRLQVSRKPDFFPAGCLGIIGADFFRDFVLTIDFKQQILRIRATDRFDATDMTSLKMATIGNSNPIVQKVRLGDLPALDYLVDAGNSGPILIQKSNEPDLIETMGAGLREYAFKHDRVRDASGKIIASGYYTKTVAAINGIQCPEYEVSGLVNVESRPKYSNMGLAFLKQVFESVSFDFSKKQFYYKISAQRISQEKMDREVYFSQEDSAFFTGPVLIQSAWYKQGLKPGMQVSHINEESPAVYIRERKEGRSPGIRSITISDADGKSHTIIR